ncbi:hypothetical protein WJX72_002807 [[Myrmecia] bisecta]|uniref:Gamma-soluble NSF attachment protein n=1 Tax=[Myrmecia] bisecta TaxID=41462 RepID=A0AAW1Q3L6_9CHLO
MALSEEEADKLVKKAQKYCGPSILAMRAKADWEQATPLFEKAAGIFKQNKAFSKAKHAYEKAATGQDRQGSPWHAAKNVEKAAELAKEAGAENEVPELYRRAAGYYAEAGRGQAAAEALAKGARAMEASDPKVANELYLEAVEALEADGKEGQAADIFRQAIGNSIRQQRWGDATGMLMRYALACESSKARSSQCKAYLGAVVVWLYAQDASQAWATYQDALGVDNFTSCEEAFAADALFDAYKTGDAEEVRKVLAAKHIFKDLDNQVARLALKLPVGDVVSMAAVLGGGKQPMSAIADGLDEDDLT